jgi:glycosyltransferase involved in cell wall biosynthesis
MTGVIPLTSVPRNDDHLPDRPVVASVPVSVVIPAFERADRVALAVASALQQDPAPIEVIVVDDGSTDATAAVAKAAGATVLRHGRNCGQGPARNTAMEAATQEWVAFLDADDEWRPGHLARLWANRADHVLVADAGRGTENHRIYGFPGPGPLVLDRPGQAIKRENPVLPSGAMVRRADALAVGGFSDRRRVEDLEFLVRVLERGTALVLPDVGVDYFQHAGQITADGRSIRSDHLATVRSFDDRPWFDRRLLAWAEATVGWDSYRNALRTHAWREAGRELPHIAGSPTRVCATLALLRRRRHVRRRVLVPEAHVLGRPVVVDYVWLVCAGVSVMG